ncbi:MAG: hypothetical protein P1P76_08985 [Anaerolineales bacterium]|nr:hypothetical protein [Anaerolineales bacterium]
MKKFSLWTLTAFVLLISVGCTLPANQENDLDAIVAATLAAVDTLEALVPPDTPVPSATPQIPDEPAPTPTPEFSPTPMSDTEAIKAAMLEYLENPVDEATITVSEIEGDIARGGLQGAYFLAAKEGGSWKIVYAGQSTPYCRDIDPYDFPTSWISQCLANDGSIVERDASDQHPDISALGAPTWTDSMDSQGRWYLVSTANTLFKIEGGALVMTAIEPGFDEWGIAAGADQADFYLEVTAKTGSQCSGLDSYGVIFRVPDPSRGYVFQLSCDGRFQLYLWDGSQYTGLQNWRANDAIKAGPDKENKLGVMVVDKKVKLYANDQLLGEYTIEEYDQGRFGLVVGASETDNFKVEVETVRFWDLGGS